MQSYSFKLHIPRISKPARCVDADPTTETSFGDPAGRYARLTNDKHRLHATLNTLNTSTILKHKLLVSQGPSLVYFFLSLLQAFFVKMLADRIWKVIEIKFHVTMVTFRSIQQPSLRVHSTCESAWLPHNLVV